MIAVVGLLLLLYVVLKLHEWNIYPLREATRIIHRPWFEATLLLFFIGGLIQYGATKGTNGTENANQPRLAQRSDLQVGDLRDIEDNGGDLVAITNLCFTGIVPLSNSVCLSVAWPSNMFVDGVMLDFFVKVNALTNEWTWLDAYSTLPHATNLEVEIAHPVFALGLSAPSMMFFRVQDRATCALTMRDSDFDGIPDIYELNNGTNPYVSDAALVPRLTVGQNGAYASVEAALADSAAYSVIALEEEMFVQSKSLILPSHPVLIEGPEAGYAVIQSDAEIGAIMLTNGQDAQTMFRNLIVDLRASRSFQVGFWVGGNTPLTGRGAAATFENVRVRTNYPGVEYFGWLFYGKEGGPSHLKRCVMNAAGSTWAYGVSSYNAASNIIEDCAFLNMPTNIRDASAVAILSRESTNGVIEVRIPEVRTDLSWAGYSYDGVYSLTKDADGDGISDFDEVFRTNTDPWLADSDGDEISDGDELLGQTDPQNLNSHRCQLIVSVRNTDVIPNVTNYVFIASNVDQWSNLVYQCSGEGGSTNFLWKIEDGTLLVSSFRDLNQNGIFDPNDDIVLSNRVSELQAVANLTFSFGDIDGDGIADIQELTDDSDPYDASQFCFNLTLVEQGIFHTTNFLSGEICFGSRTICGPLPLSGRQWVADVGHVVVSNCDQLVAYFWEDVNANGARDVGEICITQQMKIVGHENFFTNTLEIGGFDMDSDGMLDFWENLHHDAGLSPTNATDAFWDTDADGLINLHEYWANCNPMIPDGSNTVLSIMARSIDDRLKATVASNAKCKFENYRSNGYNHTFLKNPNFWAIDVDTTCASVWNNFAWPGEFRKAGTLISRRHMVFANHFPAEVNKLVWFVGTDGNVYSNTIVNTKTIIGTDIQIALLATDTDEHVSPAMILPKDFAGYMNTGKGLPVLAFDYDEQGIVYEIETDLPIADSQQGERTVSTGIPASNHRILYHENVVVGDSGNPCFLLFGTNAVFLGAAHTGNHSVATDMYEGSCFPFVTYYAEQIQDAMDALCPGYLLHYLDLNEFECLGQE